MSTNDTVVCWPPAPPTSRRRRAELTRRPDEVCADLARQLIADAEGAKHDIAIGSSHAATEDDALEVARAVARNNLFKCAIFGNDPNWGRILAAVGTTRRPSTRSPRRDDQRRPGLPGRAASATTARSST
jgi:glutamate N-acetyltransferase/amino-acid N-acetyltransferase